MQTSFGQNKALPIALNYLSRTLGTEIKASHINISFFDEIELNDVVAMDSEGDTLIYIDKLEGDIGLFSFLNKQLDIDKLNINGAKINLREISNGTYNYNHILNHLEPKEEKREDVGSDPWHLNLDVLELEDAQLEYSSLGSEIDLTIPMLKGTLKTFSIEELLFHFSSFHTEDIIFSYEKSDIAKIVGLQDPASLPTLPFTLIADDIFISSNGLTYDTNDPLVASPPFDLNHISIDALELQGKNLEWSDSISLDLKELSTSFLDGFEITNFSSDIHLSNQGMSLDKTHLVTANSDVTFDVRTNYNDFHSFVHDIQNSASKIKFDNSTIAKEDITYFIDASAFSEINFDLLDRLHLDGNINLNYGKLDVRNFDVKSGSELSVIGSLDGADISNLSSYLSFDISKISTSQSFIEKLFPTIMIPKELNNLGFINGSFAGKLTRNELTIRNINITSDALVVNGNGRLYNLQESKAPDFDLDLTSFQTNLNSLFSDEINLPEELQGLENIEYSGLLSGNANNISADGKLSTSLGNANLDTKIKFEDDYSDASYSGYIKTQDFDLGTMLRDSTLGLLSFDGNIRGMGLSIDKLKTSIDGKVNSIYYNGNTYRDIVLDGTYADKLFQGKIASDDEKFNVYIDGKVDLSGATAAMDVTMDIKNIDLKEFGLSDSLMILGGIFSGKVKGNTLDEITGEGSISNFKIQTQKGFYSADSAIVLKANTLNQSAKLYSIQSPFLDAEIKGSITPSTLVRYVKNYIKAYIPLEFGYEEEFADNLAAYFKENEYQSFIFSAKTKDINPLLIPFVGNVIAVNSASIGAFFSSQDTRLDIKGKIDSLIYKGILFQRGSYFFDGRKAFINGNINIEDISMNNEILVPITTINTVLNNKIADFNLIMSNEEDVDRLNLSGDMTRTDEYIVTLKDSVLLNGYNWKFSPYNQVIFGDYGFYMQDVKLSKEKQAITIYTDENENGEAIEVLFDDFTLSELTAIIDKENDYFEGKIDGALVINSLFSKPFITADLGLKNVTVAGHEAGNLSIEAAQNTSSNTVTSKIRLSGPQNDATLVLDYGLKNQSTTGELDIGKLEMAIIDPYLTKIFIDSEGHVNGSIQIKGDLNNLDLSGKLRTHNVKTTPVFTNSRYEVLNTDISFTDRKIDFGTVELKDRNGNSALVSGKINHRNLRHSVVDLKVKTEIFEFLNTTLNENELFYGNVNIKGNVSIFGPIDDIDIEGSVSAINNSNLNVSPLSIESELLNDDFIIYSGNPRKIPFDSLTLDSQRQKISLPFNVNVKVNVGQDSKFSLILNPITGDNLTCRGQSELTLKLNKAGKMELFGVYTVTEGAYYFSYGPISKEFNIKPGSTVLFNGDPLKGTLNVEAVYIAKTAVFDLIHLEADNLSNIEKSEAQRNRDINVILKLSKSIEKPEIKLDITTDTDDLSSIADLVNRRLSQLRENPDELNRQVFGLLLLDNFLLNTTGTNVAKAGTNIAISSISGLVTSQLNKLTEGLIEGFEVNFDVNSYSSDFLAGGEQGVVTELGLGIKKSLFDDRFTITAETNINLESTSKTSEFNTIAGNFILEYKLTKKGTYRVRAFRKSSINRLGEDENSSINGGSIFVKKEFGEIRKKNN